MGGGYVSEGENLRSAKRCAAAIRAYWAGKGHDVEVWLEPMSIRLSSRTEIQYVVKTKGIPVNK